MFLNFVNNDEKRVTSDFVKNGYIIEKIENIPSFNRFLDKIYKIFIKKLKLKNNKKIKNKSFFFNNLHKFIKLKNINTLRLSLISELNKDNFFKEEIFKIGRK